MRQGLKGSGFNISDTAEKPMTRRQQIMTAEATKKAIYDRCAAVCAPCEKASQPMVTA